MILINLERPIEMSNLFVRNNLVTNHASQHILPLIEAGSDNLSQPKLFPLCQLNFTVMRVALLVSYLANIWSRLRHIFCNYFGCRNIKPDSESFQMTDSRASERKGRQQCIARLGDAKPPPLGCLTPKPVLQYRLMDIQCTLSPDIGGHIAGASPANPIIIIDHHVEPPRQEPVQEPAIVRSDSEITQAGLYK